MSADPSDPFLLAVRDLGLLTPARLAEIVAWAAANRADSQAVAREVGRREWLTAYQIKEVYWGRGADLVLGPYLLLDPIGEGGMGRVFKAKHTRLGREVAVKVIRKEKLSKAAVLQRFRQEIQAVAKLSHPNVVLAFDADETRGMHFYAMEYVEGADLTKLIRERGALPLAQACDYIRQAATGLQHAFERGLVHRDVKPSNLLVTPKGQVKVLDLGLAMLKEAPGGDEVNRVTQEGLVLGTPDFLAPEQAQNPLGVDIRADVYSLGTTLFFLLTGRVPYEGPSPTDKLVQHVTAPIPSILPLRPDAPPHLDMVVQWMMAKRPEDRPQTPAQVAVALQPFCAPPPAEPVPQAYPTATYAPAPQPPGYAPVYPQQAYPAAPARAVPAYAPPGYPHPAAAPYPHPQAAAAFPAANASEPFGQHFAAPQTAATAQDEPRGKKYQSGQSGKGLQFALVGGILLFGLIATCGVGYYLVTTVAGTLGGPAGPLPDEFTNSVGIDMVKLSPGSFTMGSPDGEPGRSGNEGPAGEVTISKDFYIAKTEITNTQYSKMAGKTPAAWFRKSRNGAATPVESVTWQEAAAYCKALNQKDTSRRRGWEYRLPTEAEWEYACRAGTTTPFAHGMKLVLGRTAVFDLEKEIANKTDLGEADLTRPLEKVKLPHPAGTHEANPWGLHDLHGNVWEWCGDYYEDGYGGRTSTDPTGPADGVERVVRGGSFKEPASQCRSAARKGLPSTAKDEGVGFRVVLAPVRE